MKSDIQSPSINQSATLSDRVILAMAAGAWVQMGIDITLIKHNGITDDNRTPAQRKNPYETYLAVLDHPDEVCLGVKTGPKNGLVALDVFTHSPGQGMHALVERELICPCCDVIIRNETFAGEEHNRRFHTILLYSGKEQFSGTNIKDLPGVSVHQSGVMITLPPSTMTWGFDLPVETQYSYECHNYTAPAGIKTISDELRAIIRAAERQALTEKRNRRARGGVLAELYVPVAEGARNNEIARRAGYLLGKRKLTEAKTLEVLLDINRRYFEPPLEDDEVRNTVKSIAKKHRRDG